MCIPREPSTLPRAPCHTVTAPLAPAGGEEPLVEAGEGGPHVRVVVGEDGGGQGGQDRLLHRLDPEGEGVIANKKNLASGSSVSLRLSQCYQNMPIKYMQMF